MIGQINTIMVELDSTLLKNELVKTSTDEFNKSITDDNKITVRDSISGDYRHLNYIEYLSKAWGNHYGIVISPDILWHIVLNEIGTHIKGNVSHYRDLFTTSNEKVNISVPTSDPQLIDLNLIIDGLRNLVPTNIDLFLPKFTTTTPNSSLAFFSVFADAMTPYYNYMMYMCGFPKVKILGDESDWQSMIDNINQLKTLLNVNDNITKYFDGLIELFGNILGQYNNVDAEFIKNIFVLERCGSGSQVQVGGWINKLYMDLPRPRFVINYPTCVSKVPYKFLDTNQDFELCYGLFSSVEEDGFLIPDFGFIINEVITK